MRVGETVAGKYRLDRALGSGGMGVVFEGRQLVTGQKVAVKVLTPQALGSAEARQRFVREAQAASRIRSEHVARLIESGSAPDGAPFLVMEYLEGEDLAQRLARYGPLPLPHAVELVLQAGEALAEAHTAGIVHRDLKPANLFCVPRQDGAVSIKLLDFGISRVLPAGDAAADLSLTRPDTALGSPLYMSPEQIHSGPSVDSRADIWALGAIVYELLTGRTPFHASSLPEVMMKIMMAEPVPASQIRPDLPARIDAVLQRCLEKDPLLRFRNVGELALALAEFAPAGAQASIDRITRTIAASDLSMSMTSDEAPLFYTPSPAAPAPVVPAAAAPAQVHRPSVSPASVPATPMPPAVRPSVAPTVPMRASVAPTVGMRATPAPSAHELSNRPTMHSVPPPPARDSAIAPPRRAWKRDIALALGLVFGALCVLAAIATGVLYALGAFD